MANRKQYNVAYNLINTLHILITHTYVATFQVIKLRYSNVI